MLVVGVRLGIKGALFRFSAYALAVKLHLPPATVCNILIVTLFEV